MKNVGMTKNENHHNSLDDRNRNRMPSRNNRHRHLMRATDVTRQYRRRNTASLPGNVKNVIKTIARITSFGNESSALDALMMKSHQVRLLNQVYLKD